ncbi:MAG TPA: hypothetical protein VGN48_08415 [Pedococcus sp.]|jgi:hypothetical protein|nr:hypothetical protein [Pedococcus sp.]
MNNSPLRGGRLAQASALFAAPLLWLAAEAVSPKLAADPSEQLAIIGRNPERWYAYTLLLILGTMAFVPAVLALMRLAAGSPRLAAIGGTVLGLGTLVAVGDAMSQLMVWQMVGQGADRRQMVALIDRFDNASGSAVVFAVGGLGFLLGAILLSIGLVRTRRTPAWATLLFAVGIVVQLVGFTASSVAIVLVSSVILLAGMSRQAMSVLAPTRTPEPGRARIDHRGASQLV